MGLAERRLFNQKLLGPPFGSADEAVRGLLAVQAQDYPGAKWALGRRVAGIDESAVDELLSSGAIVRTHVMRPTWHFVHRDDIRALLELTAPRVEAVSKYYLNKTGIDAALRKKSNDTLARALAGGARQTRTQLAERLKRAKIDAEGVKLAYLLMCAELDRVVISGGLRGKQHTYALFDEVVPAGKKRKREEILVEVTERYFASHGPALAQDFAWWSGLTIGEAKKGIAASSGLERDGEDYLFAATDRAPPRDAKGVLLLPNYDEYLIAYKDRSAAYVPGRFEGAEEGLLNAHFVVVDGKLAGGWRREVDKKTIRVSAKVVIPLKSAQKAALKIEAERYAKFFGRTLELELQS